jgi:cholesterol transport system auxiliary component
MRARPPFAHSLTLGLMSLGLAGCLQLNKSYPEKQFYALEVSRPGGASATAPGAILRVRRFAAAPQFEGRGLVYRTGEWRYESDFYHEWFIAPSALVTHQVERWLAASGLFRHVLDPGSALEETQALEGTIEELYGDYRDATAPKAVLALRVRLSREAAGVSRIVLDQDYRQAVTVPDESPDALVRAWNEELQAILAGLEADLRRAGALH